MAFNLEQSVTELLEQYPGCRGSYNRLVMGYWVYMEGYPMKQKTFDNLTPLESICREARTILARRPELSPAANPLGYQTADLFAMVKEVFPGTRQAT